MIRFESEKSQGFSMLDDDAKQMLNLMQHSGSVPGAIRAEDISTMLGKLEDALNTDAASSGVSATPANETDDQNDEQDQPVGLGTRAYPLVQLLKAAQEKQEAVMWDYDNSII